TGLDLVELMIRSAYGEKLPLAQKDVKLDGWAVEARIYAEDPYRGFLPSTGRLVRYRPPAEGTFGDVIIRNDTGVYEGGEISIYYDPMIAKLCTHAPTRLEAIDAMAAALDEFRIEGINHNIAFLTAIMHNAKFRSGKITTAFIAEEYPEGFHGVPMDKAMEHRFVAAAVAAKLVRTARAGAISGALNGPHRAAADFTATMNGKNFAVTDAHIHQGKLFLRIDGTPFDAATDWHTGDPVMHLRTQDREYAIQIARLAGGNRLRQGGAQAVVTVRSPSAAKLAALMPVKVAADTSKFLLCPMPGLIVSVNVKEGQEVKAGESLAIVEAMKMENVLTAERDATVKKVNARKGDSMALDDVILEFA
ncbi:MAG TPA: biotin/lipoyl-containing protein, partial [Rhizomicrobium sp.]|nr:biotin/lipoyl-containing protein [Rhizomicrobium sp.]